MSTQKLDTRTIIIGLVIAGFGLFLALAINNAIQRTVNALLPTTNTNDVLGSWISVAVAIIIVVIFVSIIVRYVNRHHKYIRYDDLQEFI